jgi:hypothetical protein
MTSIIGVIEDLHASLDAAGVPHAFGGALALAYGVLEPRTTVDVDINIFVPNREARRVFELLPPAVSWDDDDVRLVERDGQCRCFAGTVPVDLFFDTTDFHVSASTNRLTVPFGDTTIPVLAPNDLAVFKAFFNRPKDWVDLQALADAHAIDADVVTAWLRRLLGDDDERVARIEAIVAGARPLDAADDVVVNVAAQALAASRQVERCGHPTASGPCRHPVGNGRRCAAGHPRR